MKKAILLSLSMLVATGMAVAQGQTSAMPDHSAGQNNTIRGCVSGSSGNFTLTDQNGQQYKLVGDDSDLQGKVGQKVEVTGSQTRMAQPPNASGQDLGQAVGSGANDFQVSSVTDIGKTCTPGSGSPEPMNENSPRVNDETNPKGTNSTTEPPRPQLMAALQQPQTMTPDANASASQTGSSNSTTSTTTTSTQSTSQSPDSTDNTGAATTTTQTPPVTSQTPAAATPPTSDSSQMGTTPSTDTGAAASGIATPQPDTSTPPQATSNDQNKPLYERQATDVPYVTSGQTTDTTTTHSTTSTTNTTTTTPNSNQPPQ